MLTRTGWDWLGLAGIGRDWPGRGMAAQLPLAERLVFRFPPYRLRLSIAAVNLGQTAAGPPAAAGLAPPEGAEWLDAVEGGPGVGGSAGAAAAAGGEGRSGVPGPPVFSAGFSPGDRVRLFVRASREPTGRREPPAGQPPAGQPPAAGRPAEDDRSAGGDGARGRGAASAAGAGELGAVLLGLSATTAASFAVKRPREALPGVRPTGRAGRRPGGARGGAGRGGGPAPPPARG